MKLGAHGAAWDQKNTWAGANSNEQHTALVEARKHYPTLYNELHLEQLAARSA